MNKKKQKEHIVDIMKADEKDGLYQDRIKTPEEFLNELGIPRPTQFGVRFADAEDNHFTVHALMKAYHEYASKLEMQQKIEELKKLDTEPFTYHNDNFFYRRGLDKAIEIMKE